MKICRDMLFCRQLPLERCFAGRFSCSASASGPKPQGHVDVDRCGWEELTGSHLGHGEDGGVLESWRCLMTYRKYVLLLLLLTTISWSRYQPFLLTYTTHAGFHVSPLHRICALSNTTHTPDRPIRPGQFFVLAGDRKSETSAPY